MKSKSSKSLFISIALHAIVGVIGFFFWFSTNPMRDVTGINAVLISEEKPKVRRITPPKRPQVQQPTTRTVR